MSKSIPSLAEKQITSLIDGIVNRYLEKAKSKPKANSGNPFVLAILKDFEPLLHRIHGLKTSLGSELEKIAEIIALNAWGKSNIRRNFNLEVELPQNVFREIDTIINSLSNAKALSNYQNEKKQIIKACNNPSKESERHTYQFDLLLEDSSTSEIVLLEMKGPDPNTTEVPGAKRRLLAGLAWSHFNYGYSKTDSQLAIYYNNKHPKPYKNPKVHYYFDPNGGILLGKEFWNFLGKSDNTYIELLSIFEEYGKNNKKRIWEGFSKLVIK
jgi:hypothetical protein